MALNMKNDNQFDDKSSLQASVLVFFILSTKSYSVKLSQFSQLANRSMKTVEVGLNCIRSVCDRF